MRVLDRAAFRCEYHWCDSMALVAPRNPHSASLVVAPRIDQLEALLAFPGRVGMSHSARMGAW